MSAAEVERMTADELRELIRDMARMGFTDGAIAEAVALTPDDVRRLIAERREARR